LFYYYCCFVYNFTNFVGFIMKIKIRFVGEIPQSNLVLNADRVKDPRIEAIGQESLSWRPSPKEIKQVEATLNRLVKPTLDNPEESLLGLFLSFMGGLWAILCALLGLDGHPNDNDKDALGATSPKRV
jgi:hypothetical protein